MMIKVRSPLSDVLVIKESGRCVLKIDNNMGTDRINNVRQTNARRELGDQIILVFFFILSSVWPHWMEPAEAMAPDCDEIWNLVKNWQSKCRDAVSKWSCPVEYLVPATVEWYTSCTCGYSYPVCTVEDPMMAQGQAHRRRWIWARNVLIYPDN